jgi:uncharacterized membrane protein YjjP (DUF1212 family)
LSNSRATTRRRFWALAIVTAIAGAAGADLGGGSWLGVAGGALAGLAAGLAAFRIAKPHRQAPRAGAEYPSAHRVNARIDPYHHIDRALGRK